MHRAVVGMAPLILSSCMFIVPTDERTTVGQKEQWYEPVPLGQGRPMIARELHGTAVLVRGTWKRWCEQKGERISDVRVSREADFTVWSCSGSGCEYMGFFGLIAAPLTLLISGVITAAEVKGTDDRMETKVDALPARRVPCDAPGAGWNLIVNAPGHASIAVTTGADGTAQVELGDEEAARTATVTPAR